MQVFPTTGAVEVFCNERGDVTIKQECIYGGDDDIVLIPLVNVEAVIKAMRAAKRDAMGG